MNNSVEIGDVFEVSKTPDKFFNVKFTYPDGYVWNGALPVKLRYQGFEIEETAEFLKKFAEENFGNFSIESCMEWDKLYLLPAVESVSYGPDTTKVLYALRSGNWECRVCGPVPVANTQPAARLRVLKQRGFCIATKRVYCTECAKSTYHDLLVKLPPFSSSKVVQRSALSEVLKTKIYRVFDYQEACFSRRETPRNLIIDHKFPSDRWKEGETMNRNTMSSDEIKQKFQLLTNQTNMMKSRACTKCVSEEIRGSFMGIKWFYQGNEFWQGQDKYDENGCIGCPWYDLEEWKKQLQIELNKH